MRNGVLLLAFLALSVFVVSADAVDDMDSSLLAIEETLHDTPVRQSQRQFQQERLDAMRFAQTGTHQRGIGKFLKGAGKLVKTVAKGALMGAIKGGGAGALLGGVKAGLKLMKKGISKGAGKLLAKAADGMRAGAKIVGFVNQMTPFRNQIARFPRVPGPDFSGPPPRVVRYYGIEKAPRMNRLSGAASEIAPGDVGCALCQFLVQRTQQDFAAFNAAAGGKGKGGDKAEGGEEKKEEGGDDGFLQIEELPALNDKNFVEAVLLEVEGQSTVDAQLQEEEEEQSEEESEEEEEAEEESEEEEEESEEDVSLLSTDSAATTGLTSQEQQELTDVLEDTHNEAVADAVEKSINGEHVSLFGAQVTEADLAAHQDFDESLLQITDEEKEELAEALQKSDAIIAQLRGDANSDLTDADKAELAAMLEEDESSEEDSSFITPKLVESVEASGDAGFSFIETATKPRQYARTLHKAEEESPIPDIVSTSFLSLGGVTRDSWRQATAQRVNLPSTPRRFRLGDVLSHRPVWNRFDPTVAPHPNAERQKARIMFQHMLQYTYDRLEGYCSTRLPEQFFPFCGPMLRNYRLIAEGIRYGDRPDQICMRGNFCPKGSYLRVNSPHSVFARLQ